ncbi:MAG: tRNA lysidine(34) synthetase TilS [Peptostreptococcaceae bacterium]|nr:tRNA lysidine(34) synthetase TilS [Peptostreptococcaceae bacterium]
MEKIIQKILDSGLIVADQHIVIGLSGGPDSMCLFYALDSLAEEMNLKIYPVHLNHKFRPVVSDEEQEKVEKLCIEKGWPCRSYEVDCLKIAKENKIGSEEAGRNERYKAFAEVADSLKKHGIDKDKIVITVAQNANDQSETIMFRILRGTSISGLSGIKSERYDEYENRIVRPLLNVTRKEIDEYIEELGLEPNIDASNFEPVYNRNRIRLELFPYVEENINSGCQEAIRRLGEAASIENEYMNKAAQEVLRKCIVEYNSNKDVLRSATIDTNKLGENHKAIVLRIIDRIIMDMNLKDNVSRNGILDIYNLIVGDNPSASYDISKNYVVRRKYNLVIFEKSEEAKQKNQVKFKVSIIEKENFDIDKPGCYAIFDYVKYMAEHGKTETNIKFRARSEGDYIPFNKGSKKLHDYLIDEKIPKEERDDVYFFAIGREILWMVPNDNFGNDVARKKGKYSQKYHMDNRTRLALLLEIIG